MKNASCCNYGFVTEIQEGFERWRNCDGFKELLYPKGANRFVDNNCWCTTGCSTIRCQCLKRGLSCTTHCHSGKHCSNQKHDHKTTDLQMYSKTEQEKRKYEEERELNKSDSKPVTNEGRKKNEQAKIHSKQPPKKKQQE